MRLGNQSLMPVGRVLTGSTVVFVQFVSFSSERNESLLYNTLLRQRKIECDKEVCQAGQQCPRYQREVKYRVWSLHSVCCGTRLLTSLFTKLWIETREKIKITLIVQLT